MFKSWTSKEPRDINLVTKSYKLSNSKKVLNFLIIKNKRLLNLTGFVKIKVTKRFEFEII